MLGFVFQSLVRYMRYLWHDLARNGGNFCTLYGTLQKQKKISLKRRIMLKLHYKKEHHQLELKNLLQKVFHREVSGSVKEEEWLRLPL